MELFKFEKDFNKLDYRSIFANRVLKLIYQKHNGDLEKSMDEAELFFKDFEDIIRNFYELVYDEVPLYAYYRLLKYGADAYGLTEAEYLKAKETTRSACEFYYEILIK